jgi:mannose-1-phosphate guanylyltransferase
MNPSPRAERATYQQSLEPWALVLAGGDGTRLQALTQAIAGAPIPKQYCRIAGDRSLLEATLNRIAPLVPPERTLVVVNRPHLPLAQPQLLGLPPENVLVQPENRDTGPGLLFGLLRLAERAPRAHVAVFPSDHFVGEEGIFRTHVERAARLVWHLPEKIALLGIRPTHAEPGFGYIEIAQPVTPPHPSAPQAFHVGAFREKPTLAVARRLVQRGGLWNSFVMIFRVDRMLGLLRRRRWADVERMRMASRPHPHAVDYADMPRWNFSTEFLSRIPDELLVVPVEGVNWNDWGTQEAIERTLALLKLEPQWRRLPPRAAVEPRPAAARAVERG